MLNEESDRAVVDFSFSFKICLATRIKKCIINAHKK